MCHCQDVSMVCYTDLLIAKMVRVCVCAKQTARLNLTLTRQLVSLQKGFTNHALFMELFTLRRICDWSKLQIHLTEFTKSHSAHPAAAGCQRAAHSSLQRVRLGLQQQPSGVYNQTTVFTGVGSTSLTSLQ